MSENRSSERSGEQIEDHGESRGTDSGPEGRDGEGVQRRSYLSLAGAAAATLGVGSGLGAAGSGAERPDALAGGEAAADLGPVVDVTEFGADPSDPDHDDVAGDGVRTVASVASHHVVQPLRR